MKHFVLGLTLLVSFQTQASIEYLPTEESKATSAEIQQNRACFEEVSLHGCGAPGEDNEHFNSCVNNVSDSLTSTCKKMMKNLYGV